MSEAGRDERPLGAGLQHERTQLAWTRTALGYVTNGGLLVRFATHGGPPLLSYLAGALLLVVGFGCWGYARWAHGRREADLRAGRPTARPRALRAVWAATALAALAVAATTLLAIAG